MLPNFALCVMNLNCSYVKDKPATNSSSLIWFEKLQMNLLKPGSE